MSVYVEVVAGGLEVMCCPVCNAPVRGPIGDGSTYICTNCEWSGGGYVTAWDGYPKEPTMAPGYIGGPLVLTGGSPVRRRYVPEVARD